MAFCHFFFAFLFFWKNQTGYQHDKVNHWTKTVVDNCLGVLTKLQKPYKYIGKYRIKWIMWNFKAQFSFNLALHWYLFVCFNSDVYDHAEEWCWSAYGQFLLLEQRNGWLVHSKYTQSFHQVLCICTKCIIIFSPLSLSSTLE